MKSSFHKVAPLLSVIAISSSAMAEEAYSPPPASVTCMAVLVGVSVEAGRLCLPAYNPDGQARLQTSLKKLEARLLASPGWDEKRVDDYMREEGARGLTDAGICGYLNEDNDTLQMIRAFIDADPVEFSKSIDEVVARPGDPSKGDCI
jgi:hypothetical protein